MEAEARRAGFDSIYLYTHEKMTENLALYSRIGYVEYDRRSQGDFFTRLHEEAPWMGSPFDPTGCHTGFLWVNPARTSPTGQHRAEAIRRPGHFILVLPLAFIHPTS